MAVYNCNHAGRIAEYPILAAERGMIGLLMVKAFGPIVAPWGGKARILSTSPMSFAIPAKTEPPIVADFATSMSAEGKVRVKNARGEKIPFGWVLNSEGKPTDNPADLYNGGALLPFGESKGYALNLLMESVGAALSGAGILDVVHGFERGVRPGHQHRVLQRRRRVQVEVDTMIRTIRASAPADGVKEVLIPGDPEMRETKKRMARRDKRRGQDVEQGRRGGAEVSRRASEAHALAPSASALDRRAARDEENPRRDGRHPTSAQGRVSTSCGPRWRWRSRPTC